MGRMTESSIYLMPDFKVYLGIQKGKKTLKHWFYFFFFFLTVILEGFCAHLDEKQNGLAT